MEASFIYHQQQVNVILTLMKQPVHMESSYTCHFPNATRSVTESVVKAFNIQVR